MYVPVEAVVANDKQLPRTSHIKSPYTCVKKERARALTRLSTYKSTQRTPKTIIESEEEHILCLGDMIEHEETELKKLAFVNHDFKRRIQRVATIKGIS